MKINFFSNKLVINVSIITIAVYIAGLQLLRFIYNCRFSDVIIFNPEFLSNGGIISLFISFIIFISGFLLLFFIQGWIVMLHFEKVTDDISRFMGLCFIVSISILIISTTFFKIICRCGLDRVNLLTIVCLVVFTGLVSLLTKRQNNFVNTRFRIYYRQLIPYVILMLIAIIFVGVFKDKIIDRGLIKYDYREENVLAIPLGNQPDDLEKFGLADSLKHHLLPYWDLEYADRFGFVVTDPPLYAFISLFSILFFGESKFSLFLTSSGFIIILFWIILAEGKKNKFIRFLVCSLILLSCLYNSLQDIDVLIFIGPFCIFLAFIFYIYLLRRNYGMALIFATAASLAKFYAIFFVILGFVGLAIFYKERRQELMPVLLKYISIILGTLLFILILGVTAGNLEAYMKTIIVEHFLRFDYFGFLAKQFPDAVIVKHSFNLEKSIQFLKWCLFSTGFTFPLLFLFGKGKKENFFSFIGLIYFLLIFFSQYQFMRYIVPLIPLSAIVVSDKLERWLSSKGIFNRK